MPSLRLVSAAKSYRGGADRPVLQSVTLEIRQGEYVSITGPSGGGKSTLLNVLGLLDEIDSGEYSIGESPVGLMTARHRAEVRSRTFGFVFQNFHLLDKRPARRSAELGLLYQKVPANERRVRSDAALAAVGLDQAADQMASTMSGGQRQRVAIARALASNAPVILADEPTGNLDSENSLLVIGELERAHRRGATLILVTHDQVLADRADRQLRMVDGRLNEAPTDRLIRRQAEGDVESDPPATSPASVLAVRDAISDAAESLISRPARSLSLVAAVALGIGLTVSTLGISFSASAQVSDDFDAHVNRDVTVTWAESSENPLLEPDDDRLRQLEQLSGVEAVGLLENLNNRDLQVSSVRDWVSVNCYAVSDNFAESARLTIRWSDDRSTASLRSGEVLLGSSLARQLEVGPLAARPTVLIASKRYTVAGIVEASPRAPELSGAVLLQRGDIERQAGAPNSRVLILTQAGAAQQVARQAPTVIDPYQPEALEVVAPVDPADLRAEVQGSVSIALTLLTIVALAGAIAGLSNSMLLSVGERRHEIGLRSAVGGRAVHSATLFMLESVLVGFAGGIFGLVVGLLAILIVTISMGWAPLFDFRLAGLAVLGGVVVGAIAGVVASGRAARINPADALRL